jgi:DNA-directed RNA polymerase specialized sigma24 family protein
VVLNAIFDRLRFSKSHPFPQLLTESKLPPLLINENHSETQLDELADQLSEQSTAAAEILSRVRNRVKPATWDSFVRRELLQEEVSTIAEELDLKKASVYQSVSRVRSIIKQESKQYFEEE